MVIRGELTLPGDKSLSHRALMFAALTDGECVIENLSSGCDVESTRRCLQAGGIFSTKVRGRVLIKGGTLTNPSLPLDCGNSGTTARLLMGLLAGQNISATLQGDKSLSQRPMRRVIQPLGLMGAAIESDNYHLPVSLVSAHLKGIEYILPVASAQVKSAIILAGLGADGKTTVVEKRATRDHTEIMLKNLGADIDVEDNKISVSALNNPLDRFAMNVPGDPSTAAFFAAAALLIPKSDLRLKKVSANPTRTGFFNLLKKMGGQLKWIRPGTENGEKVGDLRISGGALQGIKITPSDVPGMIDEFPILAVLATQSEGTTEVRGAKELRVKESDRIRAICVNLKRMGANITELEDGFVIIGPTPLKGGRITTFDDHRIAMAFTIAGLIAEDPIHLDNRGCVDISCPEFNILLKKVISMDYSPLRTRRNAKVIKKRSLI